MPAQTMTVTAPNGKTLDITGDHVPTESELHDIFQKAGVDAVTPPGRDFTVLGVKLHVAGDRPRLDSNMVGIGDQRIGEPSGIAPEDALMFGQALKRIGAAGVGVLPKILAATKEATPIVKYEAFKFGLKTAHVPEPLAIPLAMWLSGYQKGGAAPAAATEAASVTEAKARFEAARAANDAAKTKIATMGTPPAATSPVESVPGGTPPPGGPPPAPSAAARPAKSPSQMLNEEAIARARAAYQARQAAAPATAPATPAAAATKPTMTAPESQEYFRMRAQGKSDAQARDLIQAGRTLNQSLGLATPTAAETQFPKGLRGKATATPPGTDAPSATSPPQPTPSGAAASLADLTAPQRLSVNQGARAWSEGRAYVDNAGNYHTRAQGKTTGPIAPWNKDVKATFPDSLAFHDYAKGFK